MELRPFIAGLQADLEGIAAVGDDAVAEAARRLTSAVGASAGLRLLDALTEAALEVSEQLPSGHVEIRLSGQDPSFVYVEEEGEDCRRRVIRIERPETCDALGFGLRFAIGISLLQPGAIQEMTTSAAAAWIAVYVVNEVLRRRTRTSRRSIRVELAPV